MRAFATTLGTQHREILQVVYNLRQLTAAPSQTANSAPVHLGKDYEAKKTTYLKILLFIPHLADARYLFKNN